MGIREWFVSRLVRVRAVVSLGFLAFVLAFFFSSEVAFAQGGAVCRQNTLLCMPSPGCDRAVLNETLCKNNCQVYRRWRLGNAECLVLYTCGDLDKTKQNLLKCRTIKAVQKDFRLRKCVKKDDDGDELKGFKPNDPAFPHQYELKKINAPGAWKNGATGQGVTVAVLDTGVNPVAELSGKLLPGFNAYNYAINGTITPGNVDTDPEEGHGTWVATTLAANTNNGLGTASPTFETKIYPVIISDEHGEGFEITIINGLIKAYEEGIRLVNLSFNDLPPNNMANPDAHPVLHQFFREFHDVGGLIFNGAGNDGVATNDPKTRNLIVVGATDKNDKVATFSNTGTPLWFMAPGVHTHATDKFGTTGIVSGTSFAGPLACSVAALIWSKFPTLTNDQVLDLMVQTAKKSKSKSAVFGFGIPDAQKATGK